MDFEELNQKVNELKAQGLSEEDILNIFFEAFKNEEMDVDDLEKAAGALGYEFSDEFKQAVSGGEDISKEEFEDTKAIDEGETSEEFKEKVEDINEGKPGLPDTNDDNSDKEPSKDDDSEDEKEEAMKLYGLRD